MNRIARSALMLMVAAVLFAPAAYTQPPPPPAAAPAPEEAAEPVDAPPSPAEEAAPAPKGDVITLKNGKVMSGVQVLRESPTTIHVQIVAGVDPLAIPRSQIAEIQYDNLSAEEAEEASAEAAGMNEAGLGKGETSLELATKLGQPVTPQDMPLQNRDMLDILKQFADAVGAPLEILPEVQQLPPVERQWRGMIPAGTSFMTILRERLPQDFPAIEADITADRVKIGLKAEAAEPAN